MTKWIDRIVFVTWLLIGLAATVMLMLAARRALLIDLPLQTLVVGLCMATVIALGLWLGAERSARHDLERRLRVLERHTFAANAVVDCDGSTDVTRRGVGI